MNKQELIDEAVEARRGSICRESNPNAEVVLWDGNSFYFVSRDYANSPAVLDSGEVICTTEEFTQRAKELGWINGYLWGKECPTNGKKPDLPDDVIVEPIIIGITWTQTSRAVSGLSWNLIDRFRIVDQRYKPMSKSEPEMSKECLNHIPDASKMFDKSWHERGEWPPAGWHGEMTWGAKVEWYECVILPKNRIARDTRNHDWGVFEIDSYADVQFRPMKSDREKFVEAATVIGKIEMPFESFISALYDAGFRAPE